MELSTLYYFFGCVNTEIVSQNGPNLFKWTFSIASLNFVSSPVEITLEMINKKTQKHDLFYFFNLCKYTYREKWKWKKADLIKICINQKCQIKDNIEINNVIT